MSCCYSNSIVIENVVPIVPKYGYSSAKTRILITKAPKLDRSSASFRSAAASSSRVAAIAGESRNNKKRI